MTIGLEVFYCSICSIPPEFCKFNPSAEKCKRALQKDNPDLYSELYEPKVVAPAVAVEILTTDMKDKLNVAESSEITEENATETAEEAERKHQTRGGKALVRDESVRLDKEAIKRAKAKITLKRTSRNRRKAITHVRGFELFGLDLKKVAKKFAGKYACGSSVVKEDNTGIEEIDIQGDFVDDLLDYIPKEFPEIKRSQIEVIEK